MKKSLKKILTVVFVGMGACAVAMPLLNKSRFDNFTARVEVSPVEFVTGQDSVAELSERQSTYQGNVFSFRSFPVIAGDEGPLREWIALQGDKLYEADSVALIGAPAGSATATGAIPSGVDSAGVTTGPSPATVYSTGTGVLKTAGRKTGSWVSKGTRLGSVVDERYSVLKFSVNAGDSRRITKFMGVEISSSRFPGERFIAVVKSVGSTLENGRSQVEVEIMNLPEFVFQPGTDVLARFRFRG